MTRRANMRRPSPKRARNAVRCSSRGCDLTGFYEIAAGRRCCAMHAAITLLGRAITEALAAENTTKGGR